MKKMSKVLVIASAIALLVVGFAACSSGGSSDLSSIGTKNEGKIIFGTNPEFAPFEFVDSENPVIEDTQGVKQYAGIDMEIAKTLAEKNGVTGVIENLEFDSLIMALEQGQVDAAIAGMTVTEERLKSVDFTDPYYTAVQVMVVPKDSAIKKAADMKDKKIVVVQGYTGQTIVDEMAATAGDGFKYEAFKKGTEAIMEVANGKADVCVLDSITAKKFIEGQEDKLVILEDSEAFEKEEYAIAVKKGNSVLLKILNDGLKQMKQDGAIDTIAAKY